ncbi:MAG TPA: HEAT repeat domain-containing protein [Ktedonobacteraceae bacterium]|nr:HEAT repeat domain-containing protein [Ktedonobacteraceae bacterium]
MSDTSLEQPTPTPSAGGNEPTEEGSFGVIEGASPAPVTPLTAPTQVDPIPPAALKRANRSATIEHLAAIQKVTPLSDEDPDVKQKMSDLRTDLTTLLTDLRWGGYSVKATVERLTPLLDVGPLEDWAPVLVPTILEIDRAGNLVPAWIKLVEEEDPQDIPEDANPANTTIGRARRVALLMLGYYKTPELSQLLGKLASDPRSSLYATQSLVKQGTVAGLQGLMAALKTARGWAKVDVIDTFASLNQARFHEIMLASGLNDAEGLESYIAPPLYRTVQLENYLRGGEGVAPRLTQQATLVFAQVIQDHNPSATGSETPPVLFERDVASLVSALLDGVRLTPDWRGAVALHRLGLLVGRYWGDISRGVAYDQDITQQIYACLPLMPAVEQWMNSAGRVALLDGLANDESAFSPCLKALRDLREAQAVNTLLAQLDRVSSIQNREQASRIGQICDTLAQLYDPRTSATLQRLVQRTIPAQSRAARNRRSENLAVGDPDIPASIVYGASLRALASFQDRSALDLVLTATRDFDPYVRAQALEALKGIDPTGEDPRSREAVRDALNDPRDAVARTACQLAGQYRDLEAMPILTRLAESRPQLGPSVQDALRRLG